MFSVSQGGLSIKIPTHKGYSFVTIVARPKLGL